ncbi:MAG: lipid A biosynthesis acyltransferase [Comamonas sp.]
MTTRLLIVFLRVLGWLPLSWVRAFGWLVGRVLFLFLAKRRHVVRTNLRVSFPEKPEAEREALARDVFVKFCQSSLDRGWLWHASPRKLEKRLKFSGDVQALQGQTPTIAFCPHFFGLDAGAVALSLWVPRDYITIYARQLDPVADEWIKAGRLRFGSVKLLARDEGVKPIVSLLRQGGFLYLLPDMDFGPSESLFVPFFGVPTATVPSLSRFSRLGRAQVLTLIARLTPTGYDINISPVWPDFPSDDAEADTTRMNAALEAEIRQSPSQYYWVHKRFKTRPPGDAGFY